MRIRDGGAPTGVLAFPADGRFDLAALRAQAAAWPGLEGMDLAKEVTCRQTYELGRDCLGLARRLSAGRSAPKHHVVAVDYGAKRNILRCLASAGCRVTVVPATATAEDILRHKPDGVFLSNGPGDPAATGEYAVPAIRGVLDSGVPIFGICLGHQLLALALGAQDLQDGARPSRRQPAGEGPDDRQGGDHQPEPRLRGGCGDAAGEREGDARVAVRRHERGHRLHRPAGVLRAVPSRGQPGPERQPLSVRALRRDDRAARDGAISRARSPDHQRLVGDPDATTAQRFRRRTPADGHRTGRCRCAAMPWRRELPSSDSSDTTDHAQAHRHPVHHDHRRRPDRHRPGLRVRLFRRPGVQGAAAPRAIASSW